MAPRCTHHHHHHHDLGDAREHCHHDGPGFGRGRHGRHPLAAEYAARFGGPRYESPGEGRGGPFGGGPGWGRGFGPGAGGRGGFGPGGRGRGPRAARGDIRAGILVLLAEESMHGYQVMRELTDRSGGVWRPSPGSIYPQLQQLQDEGLVVGEEQAGGRRMFTLTDEGRKAVAAREDEPTPWDAVSSEASQPHLELRDLFFGVAAAVRQVGEAGTAKQVSEATAVLREVRRSLYRILAEDETGTGGAAEEASQDG